MASPRPVFKLGKVGHSFTRRGRDALAPIISTWGVTQDVDIGPEDRKRAQNAAIELNIDQVVSHIFTLGSGVIFVHDLVARKREIIGLATDIVNIEIGSNDVAELVVYTSASKTALVPP